jgi:hypothetical protein
MPIDVHMVNLDLPEKVMALMSDEAYNTVLIQLANAARDKWIQLAAQGLNSTRKDYIDGIQEVKLQGNLATVALVGEWPNKLEHGWEGGDMRDTLLAEDAPHQDTIYTNQQGGRYRHVPFRHQTPGTRGTAGAAMGTQYSPNRPGSLAAPHAVLADVKQLGKRIHRKAKQLEAGGRLQTASMRKPPPKLRPHHVTNIFEGMIVNLQPTKLSKAGKGPPQRTYTTFRTISEDNPIGWMHPGVTARNFADEVVQYVQRIAPSAFETYVRNLK